MGSRTDKFGTVGDFIIREVGVHVPPFHPFGYDSKPEASNHLDPLNRMDVVMFDLFGDQHLLTESLRVT